jgi:hypothetical protein
MQKVEEVEKTDTLTSTADDHFLSTQCKTYIAIQYTFDLSHHKKRMSSDCIM